MSTDETTTSELHDGLRHRAWRFAGAAASVGILVLIASVVISRWQDLPKDGLNPNWWLLLASFLMFRIASVASVIRWRATLRASGSVLSITQAFVVVTLAMLGRYVPGKVLTLAGQLYFCARERVSVANAAMTAMYDQVLNAIGAAIIVGLWMGLSDLGLPASFRWASLCVVVMGTAGLHPRVVEFATALICRVLRRKAVQKALSYGTMLRLESAYIFVWLLFGIAFYLFVISFYDLPLSRIIDCAGILAVSTILGVIVVIAPAGLGVREGAITALLSLYMPIPIAAAMALAFRVHLTLGELVNVAAALTLNRRVRRTGRTHAEGGVC